MMKQHNLILTTTLASLLGLTIGCEWTGTSSEESWNDAYSWANFSGTYRLYNLVAATPDTPTETEVPVIENQGVTVAENSKYIGQLRKRPVVAGTLTLSIGGYHFQDQGNGVLTGAGGGTIVYGTGAWTANTGLFTKFGDPIVASYTYLQVGVIPGAGGSSLTSFTVNQQGNLLTFTDNNGVVYSGKITGASVPPDSRVGANVRINFEVTASNRAKIVGTLSGDWSGGTSGTLANRLMRGTYMRGKTTAEIQAASGSISITPRPQVTD